MAYDKGGRPVGRPRQGSAKRIRASFTLAPENFAWLKSHADTVKQSSSQALEAALVHYQRICGQTASPLQSLCARYPNIFWDIDPNDINQNKHADFAIERVLEFGSLASVKDLLLIFTRGQIAEVVKHSRRISRKTARFWMLSLGITGKIRCLEKEFQNQLSKPWQ